MLMILCQQAYGLFQADVPPYRIKTNFGEIVSLGLSYSDCKRNLADVGAHGAMRGNWLTQFPPRLVWQPPRLLNIGLLLNSSLFASAIPFPNSVLQSWHNLTLKLCITYLSQDLQSCSRRCCVLGTALSLQCLKPPPPR